jgi:hypothetical protein
MKTYNKFAGTSDGTRFDSSDVPSGMALPGAPDADAFGGFVGLVIPTRMSRLPFFGCGTDAGSLGWRECETSTNWHLCKRINGLPACASALWNWYVRLDIHMFSPMFMEGFIKCSAQCQ